MFSIKSKNIDMLVAPGFNSLEVAGLLSVFGAVNKHMRNNGCVEAYRFRALSYEERFVPSDSIMCMCTESVRELSEGAEILVVSGAKDYVESFLVGKGGLDFESGVFSKVERIAVLFSGSDDFSRNFYQEEVVGGQFATARESLSASPGLIYDALQVCRGDVWTSYSPGSAIDIALRFVEMDYGVELSRVVEEQVSICESDIKKRSRYIGKALISARSPKVKGMQEWIKENVNAKLTVEEVAKKYAMSSRHLNRVFCKEVGVTPSEYMETCRLAKAMKMIEETSLPLKTIAFKSGFTSGPSMRRAFVKHVSMTPGEYRHYCYGKD